MCRCLTLKPNSKKVRGLDGILTVELHMWGDIMRGNTMSKTYIQCVTQKAPNSQIRQRHAAYGMLGGGKSLGNNLNLMLQEKEAGVIGKVCHVDLPHSRRLALLFPALVTTREKASKNTRTHPHFCQGGKRPSQREFPLHWRSCRADGGIPQCNAWSRTARCW